MVSRFEEILCEIEPGFELPALPPQKKQTEKKFTTVHFSITKTAYVFWRSAKHEHQILSEDDYSLRIRMTVPAETDLAALFAPWAEFGLSFN